MKFPEKFRVEKDKFGKKGEKHGAFCFVSPDKSRVTKTYLLVIASSGELEAAEGWEHVSVRAEKVIDKRIIQMLPTWNEMNFIKDMFWDVEDRVVQYHPPKSEYVNQHPFVLHLWRNSGQEIIAPPSILVGIRG